MNKNMKIFIDPRCRISYASYYIKGFLSIVGKSNLKFDDKLFQKTNLYENKIDYNKGMVIIAKDKSCIKKNFIDFDDSNSISEKHYTWADVYAKINVKKHDLETYNKLLAIGPSFGINILNLNSVFIWIKLLFIKNKPVGIAEYLKDYIYMQIRRRPYKEYLGSKTESNYIFSISTLWYDTLTDKTTNTFRGTFFNLCKKKFNKVEGGFFYIENENILKEFPQYSKYKILYKDFILTERISPSEYLEKTKRTAIVFNTPSVLGCHGWKLAEYFAMGKAIISTGLNNEMPENLLETDKIIIVDNDKQMEEAIDLLKGNVDMRESMEKQASSYFKKHLSPEAVVEKILKR